LGRPNVRRRLYRRDDGARSLRRRRRVKNPLDRVTNARALYRGTLDGGRDSADTSARGARTRCHGCQAAKRRRCRARRSKSRRRAMERAARRRPRHAFFLRAGLSPLGRASLRAGFLTSAAGRGASLFKMMARWRALVVIPKSGGMRLLPLITGAPDSQKPGRTRVRLAAFRMAAPKLRKLG
jgi:hypothetical protein